MFHLKHLRHLTISRPSFDLHPGTQRYGGSSSLAGAVPALCAWSKKEEDLPPGCYNGSMEHQREAWKLVICDLLRAYARGRPPFDSASLYADLDPWENDALNAKIDLERAMGAGCCDAESILEFLKICQEGWFFEQKAQFYDAILWYMEARSKALRKHKNSGIRR